MAPIAVSLKHGTKKHALELDDAELAAQDGRWLKQRVQEVTSVPAEKVKILVKGGQLKVCRYSFASLRVVTTSLPR